MIIKLMEKKVIFIIQNLIINDQKINKKNAFDVPIVDIKEMTQYKN